MANNIGVAFSLLFSIFKLLDDSVQLVDLCLLHYHAIYILVKSSNRPRVFLPIF